MDITPEKFFFNFSGVSHLLHMAFLINEPVKG